MEVEVDENVTGTGFGSVIRSKDFGALLSPLLTWKRDVEIKVTHSYFLFKLSALQQKKKKQRSNIPSIMLGNGRGHLHETCDPSLLIILNRKQNTETFLAIRFGFRY